MKELIGHYVAYRKLISPSPSILIPEERFHIYAVCARFPEKLARQVAWQQQQAGVYHCKWGTDEVRVVVAGQLPREARNAPLHLFSASPELVGFGQNAYRRRSNNTSLVLGQLFERLRGEGFSMSYTMEDFKRELTKDYLNKLSPQEQLELMESLPTKSRREMLESLPTESRRELLESLPPEERLAGLSSEQIRQYLDQLNASRQASSSRPRRKK